MATRVCGQFPLYTLVRNIKQDSGELTRAIWPSFLKKKSFQIY